MTVAQKTKKIGLMAVTLLYPKVLEYQQFNKQKFEKLPNYESNLDEMLATLFKLEPGSVGSDCVTEGISELLCKYFKDNSTSDLPEFFVTHKVENNMVVITLSFSDLLDFQDAPDSVFSEDNFYRLYLTDAFFYLFKLEKGSIKSSNMADVVSRLVMCALITNVEVKVRLQ